MSASAPVTVAVTPVPSPLSTTASVGAVGSVMVASVLDSLAEDSDALLWSCSVLDSLALLSEPDDSLALDWSCSVLDSLALDSD